MNAQDLKNSILQLAVQGKLVEQREEEGTAKELLEQIKIQKERLIKEKKIKKQKALPKISEHEMPFEIPENWEWVRFGEIVNVVSARRVHQSDWRKEGIPFYRAREIGRLAEFGEVDNDLFIEEELFNKFSESGVPKAGDLMVTAVGTLGKTYIVRETDIFYYKDASVICLENYGHLSSEYIKLIMETKFMDTQIKSNSGGTTVSTLTMVRMNMYCLPLPPIEEQMRIVAKIEELMPYMEKYDKAYSKVEELNKQFPEDMQKSILQYAVQGKLVEQREEEGTAEELYHQIQGEKDKLIKEGKIKKEKQLPIINSEEIPYEIPESWKWVRLGNVIDLLSGQDFPRDKYNDINKGIPYITGASSLSDNGVIVTRWTEEPRCIANVGDVLLVCKGSGYGKTVICDIEEAHIARQIMSIKNSRFLSMKYIKYFMGANHNLIRSLGQGVIPGIDRVGIRSILCPLPPLEEQKRIVARIEEILPYAKQLVK